MSSDDRLIRFQFVRELPQTACRLFTSARAQHRLLRIAVGSLRQYCARTCEPPRACDDGIKTAFRPDADTTVVTVRLVKKGEELLAPDAPKPVTAAADLCLVKLLIVPGVTVEKDNAARSYSAGLGIGIWPPTGTNAFVITAAAGGWVGGDHRFADKIGSKVRAIVNANIGYASGITDAGQPWCQDGSFTVSVRRQGQCGRVSRFLRARDGGVSGQDQAIDHSRSTEQLRNSPITMAIPKEAGRALRLFRIILSAMTGT
jgi:hypothetical protein